jgi:hypothetical protein
MAEGGQGSGKRKKRSGKKGSGTGSTGRVRLQKAVQKEMGKNSGRLAKVLIDKALAGDVPTARMLLMLTDPKTTAEETQEERLHGPTAAELLAREPSWDETPFEEKKRILMERGEWEEYLEELKGMERG